MKPVPAPRLHLLGLAADLVSPLLLAIVAAHPGLAHVAERLTWTLPPTEPGSIWIHAASLGEGRAAAALAAGLQRRCPSLPILHTATSDAGRCQGIGADLSVCLPADIPWMLRRFARHCRPRALLLVEGELWPALLGVLSRRIPIAVVGFRVGPGTRRFARLWPRLFRELLSRVELWTARDRDSARWLRRWLGQPVPVTGDLKLEAPLPQPAISWGRRPCLVAGSTHAGEESLLLDAWESLPDRPLLLLTPRHAHRFAEVALLLNERGLAWMRRSELKGALKNRVPVDTEVLLVDSAGELAGLYHSCAAAYVGGTFTTSVGAHSAAEPTAAGVSIIHGPHVQGNEDSFTSANCFPAASPADLPGAILRALAAPAPVPPGAGLVDRVLDIVDPLLHAPVPPETSRRPWAWPLVPFYLGLGKLWRAAHRPTRASVPVIGVGNLASGGTGKTPTVAWISDMLMEQGLKVAIITRGHGRNPAGPSARTGLGGQGSARKLGDEAAMLARRGYLVVSCPDRALGARRACGHGAQILVLDDAMQQRDLQVDLLLLMVDARHPRAGGPIPVGERLEVLGALSRADVLWVNHGAFPQDLVPYLRSGTLMVESRYLPACWISGGQQLPLDSMAGRSVVAFAGIARPAGFFRLLRQAGLHLAGTRCFPDHHVYSEAELQALADRAGAMPLVTTEKDLARIHQSASILASTELLALKIELDIVEGLKPLCEKLRYLYSGYTTSPAPTAPGKGPVNNP